MPIGHSNERNLMRIALALTVHNLHRATDGHEKVI